MMEKLKPFVQFIARLIVGFLIFYGICYLYYRHENPLRVPLRTLENSVKNKETETHRIPFPNTDIVIRATDLDYVCLLLLACYEPEIFSAEERLYLSPQKQQELFLSRNKAFLNYHYSNCAFVKRQTALRLSREQYTYKWFNYQPYPESPPSLKFLLAFQLDGVSNVVYNVSYLCNIPKKVQISCNLGFSIIDVIYLIWGGLSALFMLPLSFLIGAICHPWETLANLSVGIVFMPPDSMALFSLDYWRLWVDYVCNTNIIASLWDLLYHGIAQPLIEFVRGLPFL